MGIASWDDLDAFLDVSDFAVLGMITPQSGPARVVKGIYDGPYQAAQMADMEQDTIRPKFTCKQADVLGIKRGDGISIAGHGMFGILTEPQPDGTGLAVLELALE